MILRKTTNKGNRVVKTMKLTEKGQQIMDLYADKMKNDLNNFLVSFDQQELKILEKVLKEISAKISERANIQI